MKKFSTLDLLDLPRSEREIFLHLVRQGPADAEMLAEALGHDLALIQDGLAALLTKGRIQEAGDGRYEITLGRVTRRTTLPPQLWPALVTTDRSYSEQEIATLRTAVPMLQFARAKLSEFTDHGPGHAMRVKSFATQLSYIQGLSAVERHLLRAGALFHDIGNVVSRERHNIISQETVEKLVADGKLPYTRKEAEIIGLLCRWHRKEYDPNRVDRLRGDTIRTGYLASILRVADAMDIDHRRSDYGVRFWKVLEFFFPDQLYHWTSLEQILGVRIRCTPTVHLQVFTKGRTPENVQIDMLSGDLTSTPLDWKLVEIVVGSAAAATSASEKLKATATKGAMIAFPFEIHSLVMAALSRKHLVADGYDVELLCYPDTADGPAWLWREALQEIDVEDLDRLIIIGDRPDPSINSHVIDTIRGWQAAGLPTCVLNRHETNWSRLPQLIEMGVEVILGGDWVYFWGDNVSEMDLIWGRIAALCTRDPTQSTVGVTDNERAITQGLLNLVYDVMIEPPVDDTAGWAILAEPFLDRIEADDQAYFADQAVGFLDTYAKATTPGHVEGRVVVFDQAPAAIPQAFYWIMEAAIEDHGRVPERSVHYNAPYSIATWKDGDETELLAISHWREEEAIPIRLFYPAKLGPRPQGNESTIRIRISSERVGEVVHSLLDRCNRP
ncbi:MAG: HD domain-containing protein [Anaerolineaceae bacterium]|nr:MAG: HD domain-containing protein [Anaerolineaceae bacterium]